MSEQDNDFIIKKPFWKSKKFIVSLAVAGVVVIGILAWLLIPAKDQTSTGQTDSQNPAANSAQVEPQPNNDLANTNLSESYTNDFLRLTLKYPSGWQASDENDVILVRSPDFSYQLSDGSSQNGFFKIYIKQQATSDDGEYLGRGYAIAPSKKIAYSAPEPGQRPETFLTDFGLDNSDNFAYFVVQGNFDLKQGETLGPNFANEAAAFLIAGGFSSAELAKPMQTNLLPVDSYVAEQAYETAVEIIKSLQLK